MLGSSLWDLQGVQACLHLTATRSSPSSHSSSDQREEVSLAQGWQEPSLHAKIAGHRAGFCETALTPSYSLLHSQVVPLAQGTEPCRHIKPHVCTEKKAVWVCLCEALAAMALCAAKRIRRACDVGWRFLLQPLWQVNCCWLQTQCNLVDLQHRTTAAI